MPLFLWLLVAFLLGVLIEWALEIFFFRRRLFDQAEAQRLAHERALADEHARAEKLQADLNACANARANLEKENAALTTRANQLTGDLDAANKIRATLEANLQTRDAELAQATADLKACAEARAQLDTTVQSRDAEIGKLHAEVDGHLAQNKSLTADIAKFSAGAVASAALIKTLEGDKAGLEKQIADLQAQLAKSNADLKVCAEARAQLDSDMQSRDETIGELRTVMDGHLAQNKTLAADVIRFSAGAATTTATIKALEGNQAGLEKQIADLRAQLDKANADLNACAEARAQLNADVQSRDAEIEKLRTQTVVVTNDVTALRSRREDDETPFEAACPQHLSDIKGIGTVFESRLYDAGIGSYWELAQLSNDDLTRILQLTDLQSGRMDFDALRADARRMAKETKSMGRKWSQCKPDDLEPLEGIGHTFEKRLYDAGICTYQALANASVELLEEICHAPAQFKPDYASWIRQARELAAKKSQGE